MPEHSQVASDSIVRRGRALYERDLRTRLEADHSGRFAAIDPDTGDFEVADDELGAIRLLRTRRPAVQPFIVRIGSPTTYRMGGRFSVGSSE